MIEQDVLVQTKYGRQMSFAVCPDGPGAYPGIILYMDAPGFREELRNMARRIAKLIPFLDSVVEEGLVASSTVEIIRYSRGPVPPPAG